MKTITVIDPEKRLREVMSNIKTEWVQTCHSSTCNHMSHDPGYNRVTGDVPDEVEVAKVGASVRSHPTTIRTDDAEGKATLARWLED